MDELWGYYTKWNKPGTKGQIWFHLQEVSRIGKFIQRKSGLEVTQAWEEKEMANCCFRVYRISVWDGEKGLEIESGDACATLWMYLTPLNCTLKSG